MSAAIRAVVFDMDGTLFDSVTCVTTAYREAVLAGGGDSVSTDEVIEAYPLGPPRTILGHLLRREATPGDELAYLAALEEHANSIEVYAGVREVLGELADRVNLGVFTGASTSAARQLLRSAGLFELFPVVIGGDEVERPKPDPDGVVRACDLLGVSPQAAAYVGDSPLDLEAARRSGAVAVGAAWGHLFESSAPCDVVAEVPLDLLRLL